MKKRFQSFSFAITGIITMFKEEPNARIHVGITILVVALGVFLKVALLEWVLLTIAIGMVVSAEAFNTAIECLSDAVTKEQNNHIKKAKDLAAAGVLICATTSVIIGGIVFLPKIYDMIML